MSTGAFIRIKRGEKWEAVEVDHLTDGELNELEISQGPDRGWVWAKFLAKWIRDHVVDSEVAT